MKALIAAGGRGTRLRPITYSMNKHLIPLATKPMIELAIEKIARAGITEIAINVNENDHSIQEWCGDGKQWGVNITYLEQEGGALGVAHVIVNAREWLAGEPFVFYLGDNIVLGEVSEFIQAFQESGANGYLALSKVHDPERFGVPEINEAGEIVRVIEKPKNPPSEYAVTGIYCYDEMVYDILDTLKPSDRGELEISDVHTAIIEHGGKVKYTVMDGWWKDTGTPEALLEGNHLLLNQLESTQEGAIVELSAHIEGTVVLEEGVRIEGNSTIIGPVRIAAGSVIRDAQIGPYVAVGARTKVHGVNVERSIIMDDASIIFTAEHRRLIRDSIIGHNATIRRSEVPEWKLVIGENTVIE